MNPFGPILLIDDDADLRQSLQDLLEDEGYPTRTAGSGREALELLRAIDPPRLILVDLMMQDMNGWQFCEAKRNDPRLADIPLVVITAVSNLNEWPDGAEVLFKPFSLEELLARVQRLTGQGHAAPGWP